MGTDKQAKPRRRSRFIRIALLCIGLVFAVAVAFAGFRISLKNRIKSRLNAIRAAGYPVTMEDLSAWYPKIPPERNAANVYRPIMPKDRQRAAGWVPGEHFAKHDSRVVRQHEVMDYSGITSPENTGLSEPIAPKTVSRIANRLKAPIYARELDIAHRAAALKECRYPIKMKTNRLVSLPHLIPLRFCTEHLQLEAFVRAEQGDSEGAVQSVIASLACGRSLKTEPILISQLSRMKCDTNSCVTLERILSRASLADEQLVRLADALEEEEDPQALTRAMVGERCAGLRVFEKFRTFRIIAEDNPREDKRTGNLHIWIGRRDRDLLAYLDIMHRYIEWNRLPLPERFAGYGDALAKDIAKLPKCFHASRSLTPALGPAFQRHAENLATLRCARTAVGVERYRLARGTIPTTLAPLVPEFMESIPLDPFDGKPLRFRRLEKGYVVFSVGMNRTDYGGILTDVPYGSDEVGEPLDIPFRVEKQESPPESPS